MFEILAERLEGVFKKLGGQGRITERSIEQALREVRLALLEADVNLDVVAQFIAGLKAKLKGQQLLRSLTPEQQILGMVGEELRAVLGGEARELDLKFRPPVRLLLVGLQGSGKTTTAAKLARWLKVERGRSPLLVSTDVRRPAAIEQLRVLAQAAGVAALDSRSDQDPVEIASRALARADAAGHDVVIFDTAGRLQIDRELMEEAQRLKAAASPNHILLVADAMTGQEAARVGRGFNERLGLSGLILTKLESDARGGAALSMRLVTGVPILFAGVGEKLEALEVFHPDRLASRILGMGDVMTLVEKARQNYDSAAARQAQRKLRKDDFTVRDFADQLRALRKMGPIADLLAMVPGFKKIAPAADPAEAERELARIQAIIDSMTAQERANHLILNGRRRQRIAAGSGTSVQEVNRFVKQFEQTRKLMKKMAQAGPIARRFGLGV